MRLAPFLLICSLILLCTGWMKDALRRMHMERGSAAALCALLLFLSPFVFPLGGSIYVQPALVLLLVLAAGRCSSRSDIFLSLAAALISGTVAYLIYRLVPSFFEMGLLLSLPQALLSLFVLKKTRRTMLCCAAAPLVLSLLIAMEDLLLFGTADWMLGSKLLLDVQVCGMALSLLPLRARIKECLAELPVRINRPNVKNGA